MAAFVSPILRHSIEAIFLSVHLSVAIYIVHKICHGDTRFRTGFFYIYSAQSSVDCLNFALTFCLAYLPRYSGEGVATWIQQTPQSVTLYVAAAFMMYFGLYAHVAIAANRYMAFDHPAVYHRVWHGRSVFRILIALTLLSAGAASPRFFSVMTLVKTSDGYAIVNSNETVKYITMATSVVTCGIVSVLCAYLNAKTFLFYQKLEASRKRQRRDDFLLLTFSIFQLITQLMFFVDFVAIVVSAGRSAAVLELAQAAYPYVNDMFTLSGSTFLLLTR